MAFVKADRVQETSVTIGTGSVTLAGVYAPSYRTFASQMANGDTCQYLIINEDAANEWEIGEGSYVTATPALSRTTVLSSSNSNALVSFTSGTKRAAMLPPASAMVVEDNSGNASIANDLTVGGNLNVTGDIVMDDISVDTATFRGATSGTTTVNATAVASGALTLPAATDTLVGKATTDTLTNKSISGSTNTITNVSLATGVTGTLVVGNGGTGVTGFGVVTSKTASYAVLAADSYLDFDNNGAAGSVTFTLPASTVGLAYGFAVMEAQNLVIDAPGGVTIYLGEISTTAGGTITSNAVGSYLFIKCRSATEWLAQSSLGSWTPA